MGVRYEDEYLTCDEDAITIHQYYFPLGSKRIPYSSIRHFVEAPIDLWTGSLRIWGMGLSPHWFHLDLQRPHKTRCIILDDGNWVQSVITPNDHDAVVRILREKQGSR